jgi:predicted transcriptional regulator
MISIADIISSVSNEIGLLLFKAIATSDNYDSNMLIKKFGLTNRQFYPTMRRLMDVGLVKRINGKYRLTIFGEVVFRSVVKVKIAIEIYSKLKAIDSREDSNDVRSEEYKKLIDNLIDNQEIKATLVSDSIDNKHNNKLEPDQPSPDIGQEQEQQRKQTNQQENK